MSRNSLLLLVFAGALTFAATLLYLSNASAPRSTEPTAILPANPVGEPSAPQGSAQGVEADPRAILDDGVPPGLHPEIPEGITFNDADYPEPDDELLVIEPGDPSRYITATDRAEDRARRQRAREASLNAANYIGDDRVQALGTLGRYAGEGNAEAIAELRRILQSPDAGLRGDGLDAVAELLPGDASVPTFSAESLTDEEVERLIDALQARDPS